MVTPLLFTPVRFHAVEIRNRLWVSPMCQYQALGRDGVVTAWHQAHLGSLARGGAGLVMIEATGVLPEGRISPFCLGLWNDTQRDALAPIVAFARSQGATVGIQLGHAGRKASTHPWMPDSPAGSVPEEEGGWETVGPSAVAFGDYRTPRALTEEGLAAVVAAFVAAADRAVEAGIQVLELHAAHGYLLHEFLSPLSNRREDGYGGDL
ncbi:oxidoreductase, partial [Leucobacter sp. M11]|uniref:oxidoreductase n=1 Tax=Leucobacter sp. M11 TaxID=2993565 RepID=UPI002DAA6786|nr:oxidoreductase [Leucobacter sp. M11]